MGYPAELAAGRLVTYGMISTMAPLILTMLIGSALLPVYAQEVHKWVDSDGITHYSDEAPASSAAPVSVIEVRIPNQVNAGVESDYYSIANQWQRLREERIEREKLKLELARIRSAQQPATPQVVYVNGWRGSRYPVTYPATVFPKQSHKRHSKKLKPLPYHRGPPRQGLMAVPPGRVQSRHAGLGSNGGLR